MEDEQGHYIEGVGAVADFDQNLAAAIEELRGAESFYLATKNKARPGGLSFSVAISEPDGQAVHETLMFLITTVKHAQETLFEAISEAQKHGFVLMNEIELEEDDGEPD